MFGNLPSHKCTAHCIQVTSYPINSILNQKFIYFAYRCFTSYSRIFHLYDGDHIIIHRILVQQTVLQINNIDKSNTLYFRAPISGQTNMLHFRSPILQQFNTLYFRSIVYNLHFEFTPTIYTELIHCILGHQFTPFYTFYSPHQLRTVQLKLRSQIQTKVQNTVLWRHLYTVQYFPFESHLNQFNAIHFGHQFKPVLNFRSPISTNPINCIQAVFLNVKKERWL